MNERKEKKKTRKRSAFSHPVLYSLYIHHHGHRLQISSIRLVWLASTHPSRCYLADSLPYNFGVELNIFPVFLTVPLEASRHLSSLSVLGDVSSVRDARRTFSLAISSRERASFFFFSFSLSGWVAKFDG